MKTTVNKKKRGYKRTLPYKLIADKLDNDKVFQRLCSEFSKRDKISIDDMFELRKRLNPRLEKLKMSPLSDFWDDFLLLAIVGFPRFKLTNLKVGTTTIKPLFNEKTKEIHYAIEIYPESNKLDVLSAYRGVRKIIPAKRKLQPPDLNFNKLSLSALGKKELKKTMNKLPKDSEYRRRLAERLS